MKRYFKTLVMLIIAMVLCVSCKKDNNNEPDVTISSGDGSFFDHEYVDLGLPSGTLWATSNVNVGSFWQTSNYFAWGETTTKDGFTWSNYKWWCDDSYTLTKYNTDSAYGTIDNDTILDLEDDVANVCWGGDWRMPTYDEMKELKDKCTWTWLNDRKGFKVTGPNNKSIFLPASGHYKLDLYENGVVGYYWSGSLKSENPCYAYYLYIYRTGLFLECGRRCYGHSVRPVCSPQTTTNKLRPTRN